MQENIPTLEELLNIKIATLIAGLVGAMITMWRKSTGSLQARLIGYVTAIVTVLYVLPFLTWLINWKFAIVLHESAEHLLAFILGMLAQRLTENFIDDPVRSFYLWTENIKKFKRVIWNGESLTVSEQETKILTDDKKVEDKT